VKGGTKVKAKGVSEGIPILAAECAVCGTHYNVRWVAIVASHYTFSGYVCLRCEPKQNPETGEVKEPKYMTTEPAHSALRTTQYPEPDTLQARNTFIKEKAATRQDIKRYNLPPGAIALFGSDPVPVGYVQVYASQLISKSIKNKGKVLGGMYYFAPKLVAEGVPKKLEGEAWYTHSWNADKLGTRVQLVLEAKWVNNKGQLTKLGEKIAQSKWGDLTPAAQNVLRRGLDKLYGRPVALPTAETGG